MLEEKEKEEEVSVQNKKPFWGTNPNILLDPGSILELFPISSMSYNEKLNSISRLVILLTLLFYFVYRKIRVFIIGILTLGAIWYIHYTQQKPIKHVRFQEEFTSDVVKDFLKERGLTPTLFSEPTSDNPLQNVLITDYDAAPDKKPAPASYTAESQQTVLDFTKKMIDSINPEQPKISSKLFRSLEDNLQFEQSMRPFYSNPSTTIPNDQGAFADFCYGSMVSCKEGNPFACARQMAARHTN
jgi:hypothetical protein